MADDIALDIKELTAEIVANYVEKNSISATELPSLISKVYGALDGLGNGAVEAALSVESKRATPAQIRKSITPNAIVSFIDGKPYKTLRRHITAQGMTVSEYLETYGLPNDYPLVSATTSSLRSATAKAIGLGHRRAAARTAAKTSKTPAKKN